MMDHPDSQEIDPPSTPNALGTPETDHRPVIEIGWIVAGHLESIDRQAVDAARELLLHRCRVLFPEFIWQMPVLHRDEISRAPTDEPIVLLEYGVGERNVSHWDFTIIVTGADLVSHYRDSAVAALSRSLEGVVISTRRIDPRAIYKYASNDERIATMAARVATLALHSLGHMTGLGHHPAPDNLMADFGAIEELDGDKKLTPDQVQLVTGELHDTADRRLEEHAADQRPRTLPFYLRAMWLNRMEIVDAIVDAKPYQFPFRLSRLTTAAVSAMLILLMTAEIWDLGMSQRVPTIAIQSAIAIAATTCYVLFRQRLLSRRVHGKLTEQFVVTRVATISIVFCGMLTTYAMMLVTTFLLSAWLFSPKLAGSWAASAAAPLGPFDYAKLAAFIASLCIFIAALGASFEQQNYFRHITFVDEEI